MTLHVQVVPPHDHDALLDSIQHFIEHKYEIEHVTVQMEYQPLQRPGMPPESWRIPDMSIIITINVKARENPAHARC